MSATDVTHEPPVRAGSHVRLGLDLGTERRDVALRSDVVLGDALRSALVPVDDPGVVVLDSAGTRLDLSRAAGAQVSDGALVHVVRAGTAPASRAGRWAARRPDVATRRPPPQAGLLAVVVVLATALGAVVLLPGAPRPGALALPAAVVLGLAALLVALARVPATTAATAAALALAASAGAVGVAPVDGPGRRLAVTVALVLAALVGGVRVLVTRAARAGEDDAVVLLAVVATAAVVQSATLLAAVPAVVGTAALVGAGPLVLRALPRLSLAVPDDQLVDLAHVSRTAPSVRSPRPRALGRVAAAQVAGAVGHAERRKDTAVLLVSAVPPLLLPVVLTAAPAGSMAAVGGLVLGLAAAFAFLAQPRSSRGDVARVVPRVAAAVLLLETLLLGRHGIDGTLLALGLVLVAATVAVLALPLGRGWSSVALSRTVDGFEGLATVLVLPAAAVAGGAVDVVRALASG